MASLMADGRKVAVKYVTEESTPRTFAVAMKAAVFNAAGQAAKLGAVAAEATDVPIPNELRLRAVKVTDAAGYSRYIPIYNVTATAWTTPGTTVILDKWGTDTSFAVQTEHRPERIGRKGKSVPAE